MNSVELFDKIKNKDSEAMNDLVSVYGKRVYMQLLNKLGDMELADRAFKKTMLEFFDSVGKSEADDPVEALLYEKADAVQRELIEGSVQNLESDTKDELPNLSDVDSEFEAVFSKQINESAVPHTEEAPSAETEAGTKNEVPEKKSGGFAKVISTLIMILLFAAVIWVAVGGLMTAGYIPQYDLGYMWFNENIYPLFTMT